MRVVSRLSFTNTCTQGVSKNEKSKKVISKERDKLRDIHEELGDILESLDMGIDEIECGKKEIENGIDEMSQYL